VTADVIGYDIKGGDGEGFNFTSNSSNYAPVLGSMRNPSWSPDGSQVSLYAEALFL
jgi:hypothetical protein